MSEIQVRPGSLREAGSHAQRVGGHVVHLAGARTPMSDGGDAAPRATAAAMRGFHTSWSERVARTGETLTGLGMTAAVAAALYEQTDGAVVPGS
jgi:hypothetical protein